VIDILTRNEFRGFLEASASRLVGGYLRPVHFCPSLIDASIRAKSVAHPGCVPSRLPRQATVLAAYAAAVPLIALLMLFAAATSPCCL
jgi:hypothetical protein